MNNFQKKFFKNLTKPEWHAVLKDELNWIETLPVLSQTQWEFHYIRPGRYPDVLQYAFMGVLN